MQGRDTVDYQKPYDEITGRIVIIPLLLSKGLEFDGVITCSLLEENQEEEQRLRKLYLACTRALHELYIIETKELPKELADCKAYLELI